MSSNPQRQPHEEVTILIEALRIVLNDRESPETAKGASDGEIEPYPLRPEWAE